MIVDEFPLIFAKFQPQMFAFSQLFTILINFFLKFRNQMPYQQIPDSDEAEPASNSLTDERWRLQKLQSFFNIIKDL